MTEVTIDAVDAARGSRPPVRRRRSHAALGSRVFAGGLALSGTFGLAGMMARRPSLAAANPVREAALAIVVEPTRVRAPSARARRTAAHAAAATPVTSGVAPSVPAPAPTAPSPVPAYVPVPAPTTAPQLPVRAPPPAPQPPAAAPVVVPPTAAPVTTSHASPPPP